jgi:hypothetical protein
MEIDLFPCSNEMSHAANCTNRLVRRFTFTSAVFLVLFPFADGSGGMYSDQF